MKYKNSNITVEKMNEFQKLYNYAFEETKIYVDEVIEQVTKNGHCSIEFDLDTDDFSYERPDTFIFWRVQSLYPNLCVYAEEDMGGWIHIYVEQNENKIDVNKFVELVNEEAKSNDFTECKEIYCCFHYHPEYAWYCMLADVHGGFYDGYDDPHGFKHGVAFDEYNTPCWFVHFTDDTYINFSMNKIINRIKQINKK